MRLLVLLYLLLNFSAPLLAQDFKAEVSLKGFAIFQDDIKTTASSGAMVSRTNGTQAGWKLQVSYNLNPYFNGGLFYSKAIPGEGPSLSSTGTITAYAATTNFQSFGLALQLGTNRYRKLCAYGVINFFYAQLVDTYPKEYLGSSTDLALGGVGAAVSAGVGVTLKLSRRLNFNIIEAKFIRYAGSLNYLNGQSFNGQSFESGLVYKFLKFK